MGAEPAAGRPPRATVLEPAGIGVLRLAYRDEVLALAAADLQSVCEPELPVVPVEVVAAQLADLASAGLRAALAVADATIAEPGGEDDRGPTSRCRAASPSSGWASAAAAS